MKYIITSISFQFIFCTFLQAQNIYINNNLEQIKIVDSISKRHCTDYISTFKFSRNVIKYDKKVIKFLNFFYNNDFTIIEISKILQSDFNKKWSIDSINLGNATKYLIRLYQRGNLKSIISLATIENKIIYKNIKLSTASKINCIVPNDYWVENLDIIYLQEYFLPFLEFKTTYTPYSLRLVTDTTYYFRLSQTNISKNYSFLLDSIKNFHEMTWSENDTYYADYAYFKGSSFLSIPELLYHFLFSPNHILAINAYEALVYLKNNKQFIIPLNIEEKMNAIKNSDIKICWQSSDVVHRESTYKDLKISTHQINHKF